MPGVPGMISAKYIDTALLPTSLKEIAEVIGISGTLRLVERYGGRRLCVPRQLADEHPLNEVLGPRAAASLVKTYALERIHIPKAARAVIAARDREIRRQRGRKSVPDLAAEFNLGERQVYDILASPSG